MKGASREPTPFEKFNAAVKHILTVPKDVVEAKEKALKAKRSRARKRKRATAT